MRELEELTRGRKTVFGDISIVTKKFARLSRKGEIRMNRLQRKWEDELDLTADIIILRLREYYKGIQEFEVRHFKDYLVEELERLVRKFKGTLENTN